MKTRVFMKLFSYILMVSCCLLVSNVLAEVRLPFVFSDHMVVQQNMRIPVWGIGYPGETVRVWLGDNHAETNVDSRGHWRVDLDPLTPSLPLTLTVKGTNTIKLKDVLVGEVWLCSGQSNMTWAVWQSQNASQEIAAADYPRIRMFYWERPAADYPPRNSGGRWYVCTPQTADQFSAVGYFFARELYKKLKVPVGIIHASRDGTNIEGWIPADVLASDKDFQPYLDRWEKSQSDYDKAMQQYEIQYMQWEEQTDKAKLSDGNIPEKPKKPVAPPYRYTPSFFYDEMIHLLTPYGLRGMIWYHGTNNHSFAYRYRTLFKNMIKSWRQVWGQGDFPFYFVQMPSISPTLMEPLTWAELREAQMMALTLPNTGMIVTTDIGAPHGSPDDQIHLKNKQQVGRRLALWALAKDYGQDVVCSGPLYKSMSIAGNAIRLRFDYVGGGLVAQNGPLTEFTIAGEDRNFVDAKAVIEGDTIVVSSKQVTKPVAVRFGWSNCPLPNLFNREGLPASPFRTDDWPGVTDRRK